MAEVRSGLFTLSEFEFQRRTLRLAPDAFVSINGALGERVLTPAQASGRSNLDVRGGITNITVNAAVSPAGAGRASIDVIAPQYKGLHEDYYVTLPNGVRIPYFIPMMEVKVFMKGRYLEDVYRNEPRYYPVFWGLITNVSESYSDGTHTFSLQCEDLLAWWKWQIITMRPSDVSAVYGAPTANRFPSVFKNMSAWEIIYALFTDTFFVQGESGNQSFYNFVYPKLSKLGDVVEFSGNNPRAFGGLVRNIIKYWNSRFGFKNVDINDPNRVPLEMYGLKGPINPQTIRELVIKGDKAQWSDTMANRNNEINLDFNILARVQPKGAFDLYGDGTEPLTQSKLEIAREVAEQVHMEFFIDVNGHFVFKPPFYNLDVASGGVPYYTIDQDDIINYNNNFDSNQIVNYLIVTSPIYYGPKGLETMGLHVDWESIVRHGIRYQEVAMRYGNTKKQLQLIARAETTRRNGMAYTGNLSIPLRPEMRLGYPIYIKHLDTFFYVTGLTHSFSFGASATTDISFQFRRERMFDDGTLPGGPGVGRLMKEYVYRFNPDSSLPQQDSVGKDGKTTVTTTQDGEQKQNPDVKSSNVDTLIKKIQNGDLNIPDSDVPQFIDRVLREQLSRKNGIIDGPLSGGDYRLSKAKMVNKSTEISNPGTDRAVIESNELITMTKETVPFTDRNGYRHIGAFPYGANLILTKDNDLVNPLDAGVTQKIETSKQVNAKADPNISSSPDSEEALRTPPNNTPSQEPQPNQGPEETIAKTQQELSRAEQDRLRQQFSINPENNPNVFKKDTSVVTFGNVQNQALDILSGARNLLESQNNQRATYTIVTAKPSSSE